MKHCLVSYRGEKVWVVLDRELVDFFIVITENVQGVVLGTVIKRLELAEDQMDSIPIVEVGVSLRLSVSVRDRICHYLLVLGTHRSHMSYANKIYLRGWRAVHPADLNCMIRQSTRFQLLDHP